VIPYVGIPISLLIGHLAHRIGPMKMSAFLACLTIVSVPLAITFRGRWQFVPLFAVMAGANVTTYGMLAVINRARSDHTSYYLAIYFTAAMLPGMAPLGLARIFDWRPAVALGGIFVIAAALAIGFLVTERQMRLSGSAAEESARAEPNADAQPSIV